jgi:hypothetical protein
MTTATGPVEEESTEGRVDFADSRSLQWWTTVLCVSRLLQELFLKVFIFLDRRV